MYGGNPGIDCVGSSAIKDAMWLELKGNMVLHTQLQ